MNIKTLLSRAALVGAFTLPASAQCWNDLFLPPTSGGVGVEGEGLDVVVFDDGSGAALYIGSHTSGPIRRWDGTSVTELPLPSGGVLVGKLAVLDLGAGPKLFSGIAIPGPTFITYGVVSWDGSVWQSVANGLPWFVSDMIAFDSGAGPELYVAGIFNFPFSIGVNGVARWTGTGWDNLNGGVTGLAFARALEVHDDGSGPALYVAGFLGGAAGVPSAGVVRWDGAAWSSVGGGVGASAADLAVLDDGSGPALYAGLPAAGALGNIARWDGSAWASAPGSPSASIAESIQTLGAYDDGCGPALYASGVSGGSVGRIRGGVWESLERTWETGQLTSIVGFDDGSGPGVYVAGLLTGRLAAGGEVPIRFDRWSQADCRNVASVYCSPAAPNSSGAAATLRVSGLAAVGGEFMLCARDVAPQQFGYLLASRTQGLLQPPGSQGTLCLGGSIGRYVSQLANSGAYGQFEFTVDTNAIPVSPPQPVLSGETWNFQAWFRDVNPGPTSNFTDAGSVTFP